MKKICLSAMLACLLGTAQAQCLYAGIFSFTEAELDYREALSWPDFEKENQLLTEKGFRLTDLETALVDKERRYWGIWTKGARKGQVRVLPNWTEMVKAKREMDKEGFLMTALKGYAVSETDFTYIAVWEEGKTPHKIWKLDTRDAILQKTEEMARENFFLVEVEALQTPAGKPQYLLIFHLGTVVTPRSNVALFDDARLFHTDMLQRTKSGNRLIDYERFIEGQKTYHLGVYRRGTYDTRLVQDLTKADFEGQWDNAEKDSLKLTDWEVRPVE